MTEPGYQEFPAEDIPVESLGEGGEVRVIAGTTVTGTRGPVVNEIVQATYMHVTLPENTTFEQPVPADQNTFVYVISGSLLIGNGSKAVNDKSMGVLTKGDRVCAKSASATSEFLLVSGNPLNEPVARQGPFVMNTQAELIRAFDEYRYGRFVD